MKLHGLRIEASGPDREHPVVGILALAAILAAVLAILWIRVAVVGTRDVEKALALDGRPSALPADAARKKGPRSIRHRAEEAAARSRWATGFSH